MKKAIVTFNRSRADFVDVLAEGKLHHFWTLYDGLNWCRENGCNYTLWAQGKYGYVGFSGIWSLY